MRSRTRGWIVWRACLWLAGFGPALPGSMLAQEPVRANGDSVALRFVDADLRAVISALGPYLPKPVVAGSLPGVRVSLETPGPVPRRDVPGLLRGLLQAQGQMMSEDSLYYRVEPVPPPPAASPRGAGPAGPSELHVIRLRHARAADVAATIAQLFGGDGGFAVRGGLSTGTLSDELRRAAQPAAEAPRPGRTGGGQAASMVVVPDEVTNSLLVRGTEGEVAAIRQAVEQLDVRPLQVLIEILIVEARRDRSFSLNANVFVPPQPLDGGTIGGQLQGGGLGDLVIRLLSVGKADVDATIGIAASRGDVDILSRPVLVTSNNTEARFLVGSQRPFVALSRTLPTDEASRDQVVQYRDVGTKLVVRPTINHDGYVSLLIQQEITAATSEVQFDAPVISTREAATQVLVKDGQTILLGGLRDEQKDRVQSGVPLLSTIPILGGLFGSASRRSSATELFLFLTPRILRTDEEVERLTEERMPEGVR
ncbi:MAG TPA: secretin N-terminal domain-containing protein [Gemmatimonadales bacterium]|nr:secretin N-terminal domain-containing protein [Gemmatimonadales bacterium]